MSSGKYITFFLFFFCSNRQSSNSTDSQSITIRILENESLNRLIFELERDIKWPSDIIFRKRNIIWKAIKSLKPENEQLPERQNKVKFESLNNFLTLLTYQV